MSRYYVGLAVHKASVCIAVLNAEGKLVMESVVETSAATILDFLKGLRGQVRLDARDESDQSPLPEPRHRLRRD